MCVYIGMGPAHKKALKYRINQFNFIHIGKLRKNLYPEQKCKSTFTCPAKN